MSNVTRFPGPAATTSREGLTTAHMFLIYSIMDLAVRISRETDHIAECRYAGHVHWLEVSVVPPQHKGHRDGGDDSYKSCYQTHVRLPGNKNAHGDTLQQLGDIITALQQYLPPSGGAA